MCKEKISWLSLILLTGGMTQANEGTKTVDQLVREAQFREIGGDLATRDALLAEALQLDDDHRLARHRSGFLQVDKDWVAIDDWMDQQQPNRIRMQYVRKRDRTADTAAAQLALANWCASRKLFDEESAHLHRVVQLQSDHEEANQRLRRRQVNGRWVEANSGENAFLPVEYETAWRMWSERIERSAAKFRRGSQRAAEDARTELRDMLDRSALPAMEVFVLHAEPDIAVELVALIAERDDLVTSGSLARISVLSSFPEIRQAAATSLQTRPLDHFVPMLISEMSGQIVSRMNSVLANGRITYRHEFVRESRDHEQVVVLDKVYDRRPQAVLTEDGGVPLPANANLLIELARLEARARAQRDIQQTARQREQTMAAQNELIRLRNARIGEALRIATRAELPAVADRWWSWWDEQNEVTMTGPKEQAVNYSRDDELIETTPLLYSGPTLQQVTQRRCECFAAGTLVWTDGGVRAIERLRVGDRVVTQNVATGSIELGIVLETTVRPPEELLEIQTADGQQLQATPGHSFWVSGHGWMIARDLKSGMVLHSLDRPQKITAITSGSKQEAYNLVVDRHHCYFVGSNRILSHDNTERRPTDSLIPGWNGQ
ncbi:MAG: polymorphic toxin-type HINT domain-containing protein [Pirellulaceae bacterium]